MTTRWGGTRYDDVDTMLAKAKPDVVYVAVPPYRAVAIGERLVQAGIPFLTEKPLAASDAAGPARLAAAIERAGLVVAVGYHLRALDILTEVRDWLDGAAPKLVVARWLDSTPRPAWWGRAEQGGGQVIEQATHLYDLARLLMGEATVVGAASTTRHPDLASRVQRGRQHRGRPPLRRRRRSGPSPTRAAWRRRPSRSSSSRRGSSRRSPSDRSAARATGTPATTTGRRSAPSRTGPTRTRSRRPHSSTRSRPATRAASCRRYADALKTDRLTRAVVAATGAAG